MTHTAGSHAAGEKFPPTASQTLDRGIRVLELLARPEHVSGLTVTQVAEQLGVGRTIVYRLLATLEPHELVARAADGRLILGLGMTRFAAAVLPRLRSAALPTLREFDAGGRRQTTPHAVAHGTSRTGATPNQVPDTVKGPAA